MNPRQVSPLVFIFITIFSDKLGQSLIFPLLPFLLEQYHPDGLTLGLLVSSFSLAQFLAIPIIGSVSDRYGRRVVLLTCVLGSAFSLLLFGFANSLWVIFLSRILDGITGGTLSTASAYIADVSTPENRAKNFGLVGAAFGLGFIFGPAIGGALAHISITLPIFVAAGIAFLNFTLGYFSLKESLPKNKRQPISFSNFNTFGQISSLFVNPKLRGLVSALFLFNFAFAAFTSIFVLYVNKRYGWGPTQASIVFVVVGILATIVQGFLIGKLVRKFGEIRLAIFGLFSIATGFFVISLTPVEGLGVYVFTYVAIMMIALGTGCTSPTLQGLISQSSSEKEQGKTLGSSQALQSLASILGPIFSGWVFDSVGQTIPFVGSSFLLILALGLILTFKSNFKANS